jgi:photosystem II stability/assembly factor-like uncharacterized protein
MYTFDIVDVKTIWQCGMKNSAVSTDGGQTWTNSKYAGGTGCLIAAADAKTVWAGSINKFKKTADGGETWEDLAMPEGVEAAAAISLRTPKDGYLIDMKGALHVTKDGGKTWSSQSLGLDNPKILDFASGFFVNTTPQAAVRFFDAKKGLVVLGLNGESGMIALRTADGGKTWAKESLPGGLGKPYLSRTGRFLTLNIWNDTGKQAGGVTLLKYE